MYTQKTQDECNLHLRYKKVNVKDLLFLCITAKTFDLGLHCLQKYLFTGIQTEKG